MCPRCCECNEDTGYFYIHDGKLYCDDCYGNHVTEADVIPLNFYVVCPFCEEEITFKFCPDTCKGCGAKMTMFGVRDGKMRFIKW